MEAVVAFHGVAALRERLDALPDDVVECGALGGDGIGGGHDVRALVDADAYCSACLGR